MSGTMGIDICERARDALAGAGMDPVLVRRLDALSGREGAVVRLMPSATVATYYDGTRDVLLSLQLVSVRRDPLEAMADCDLAMDVLPLADLGSANGSYELAGPVEADGQPEDAGVADNGMHVWTARFRAIATCGR